MLDGETVVHENDAAQAIRLRALYQIDEMDLERIRSLGSALDGKIDAAVARFYEWMRPLPEFNEYLSDPAVLERVRRLQVAYWVDFLRGVIDAEFVASRRSLGAIHARIGLPLDTYLGGMNSFLMTFSEVASESDSDSFDTSHVTSLSKVLHLDTAIVIDEYNAITKTIIAEQGDALMEMSTPVTEVWADILMLPIVGVIDSRRSMEIMNTMLSKIAETRAHVAILDISGVAVIDTAVANHLIKVTRATRLMGCECLISGVSPAIAQTMVELGIDVGTVRTTATLQDALGMAFHVTGHTVQREA